VPAPLLFLISGLTQYVGAAVAVRLFDELDPPVVAWLRVLVAAVVLLVWRRPWGHAHRTAWTRRALGTAVAFGVVLAAMNLSFYAAIARLPLGTAVAIEFVGPVAVAAVTGRGWRDRSAIAVAAVGVVLLAGVSLDAGPDAAAGLFFIGLAAAFWAGYILLGRRVARAAVPGVTGLSVAMAAGAIVFAPLFAAGAAPVLDDGGLALRVVAIAVCSSVIPYAIEQVVLRSVRPAVFAVLLAMLPAAAAIVGAVVLQQVPHPLDVVGLVLVSGAIALTAGQTPSDAPEEAPPPA
jgi:inner membrane transporter RhtA